MLALISLAVVIGLTVYLSKVCYAHQKNHAYIKRMNKSN